MGKYRTTNGQNLYDIAIHIYGSIEGMIDLFVNNPQLTLDSTLKAGDELIYTDDFIINEDIVVYNHSHNIIPASGERHVYYKPVSYNKIAEFRLDNQTTSVGLSFSGTGDIEVDWGDNTPMEKLALKSKPTNVYHSFDNRIADKRKIRIYGNNINFYSLDISALQASSIYFLQPISVEKFILSQTNVDISSLSLLQGVYDMDLTGVTTGSLLPLLKNKELLRIDLRKISVKQKVLDNYLIALVQYYYDRRNCHVFLTMTPSGIYQEPDKDEHGNYRLTTGMEAIWVITHEAAWNEAGYWKFQINDDTYTTEL